MATKKELNNKKEIACSMYMQGKRQNEIAELLGVSANTITKWVNDGHWEERRAGMGITRSEIVTKTLLYTSRLLDKLNSQDVDLTKTGKIIDQIVKLSATIRKIDKQTTVVDAIEVFQALNKWLLARMETDKNITPELLQQFQHYQDLYISEKLNEK